MVKITLEDYKDDLKNLKQFPIPYIQTNSIIKLKEDSFEVVLGVKKAVNSRVERQLKRLFRKKEVKFVQILPNEFTSYISKLSSNIGLENIIGINENDLDKLANDAPVINLVNAILIDGINLGASDIHIEGYKDEVNLRYRVDGVLIEGDSINKSIFSSISSRIKIMANLNIMESRQPQDGRVSVSLESSQVDLRVSIIPLSEGESIVLRLFIKKNKILTLEDLGFSGDNLEMLNKSTKLSHGLILVTGPTGSGKTTTLNALLQRINNRERKIITIEDPVEYSVPGVNQIQVNHEIGLGFNAILKRVLRQDPDIIMIGEIRDNETAELVIRAALTGHLVLSTLHTNDAVSALSRLKDLGVADYLIASVLKVSFAQRLIRTICRKCMGEGCSKCSNIGFKGRTVISEGFIIDKKIESLILDNAKPYEISSYLEQLGMNNLKEAALDLVASEITTSEEIERVLSC